MRALPLSLSGAVLLLALIAIGCGSGDDQPPASFELLRSELGPFAPRAMSANGSILVGDIEILAGPVLLWRRPSGFAAQADGPGEALTYAADISGDGRVVVGTQRPAGRYERALRWTASGGGVALPGVDAATRESWAAGVSRDGMVVVGQLDREAVIWNGSARPHPLGSFVEGGDTWPVGVSADGRVVAGNATTDPGWRPFRWTAETGMVDLGDVPGGSRSIYARAISGDGRTICGRAWIPPDQAASMATLYACLVPTTPFCWTGETGMVLMPEVPYDPPPDPPQCDTDAIFTGVAGIDHDGSLVVGYVGDGRDGDVAVLWDADGVHVIADLLIGAGVDLGGWRLLRAHTVSADGRTIAGVAARPDGEHAGWIAVVPRSPGTLGRSAIVARDRR
jgi:probable HAF family extracellular repeat protein